MQDSVPIFVLSSEAIRHNAMPDATANPSPTIPAETLGIGAVSTTAAATPLEPSSECTDEQLMLALRDGSEKAFTYLFHRYKQPMFGFFSRRLTDSARAEELTQETFVAVFRAAKRYEPRALFRTYLYAIAFRILRSDRRKSQFRAVFYGAPKAAAAATASHHAEDSLWVRRALAKLDPVERELVMLREYQQLSYAEIATLLEIPLNTVRSRLFRARASLRDLLLPPNAPPSAAALSAPLPVTHEPRKGTANEHGHPRNRP
jgi:RNA polymerase sigma-70 factor, ECF subfamily